MTWNEVLAQMPDSDFKAELQRQLNMPSGLFCTVVKCCHNCLRWERDSLMGDDAYNGCRMGKPTSMTRWDACCEHYAGVATEKNLLMQYIEELGADQDG